MNQRQNLWTSIFRSVRFSRFKLRLVESMVRAIFVFLSMITYASCCSTESQGCLINRVSIFSAQFVYLMCSIFNALYTSNIITKSSSKQSHCIDTTRQWQCHWQCKVLVTSTSTLSPPGQT